MQFDEFPVNGTVAGAGCYDDSLRYLAYVTVLLGLGSPCFGAGVELHIQYSAIEKVLAQQAFADSGRMYVKGSPENHCSYAYLENPVMGGLDGRLLIKALFSGRSGANLFGKCLGFGDTFAMEILAMPVYDGGLMRLQQVVVQTNGNDNFYVRKVRESVAEKLPKTFAYQVSSEAKRILEAPLEQEPYRQKLQNFQITRIRVTPQALVLTLEFTLIVQ